MRYRIVEDSYAGREVQCWNGHCWEQCASGGHKDPVPDHHVNTFNSHMSATVFMAIHDMDCQLTIVCEQLDAEVKVYKSLVGIDQ